MLIEINLLPGAKKARRAGPAFSLDALKGIVQQVKDPLLVGAIAAWIAAAAFVAVVYSTTSKRLATLEQEAIDARREADRFKAMIAQKDSAQALRDSLVRELTVIRGIDSDRYVWPHILDEVTRALPDFTWLTNVAVMAPVQASASAPPPPARGGRGGGRAAAGPAAADSVVKPAVRVQITGRASDIGGYTQFLRALAGSPWLTGVEPGPTTTEILEEGTRPVYGFSVVVTFRQADSAFIQTVPVRESVAR